ncbi:MAG TPA: alkaline phosphatase family protein [Candidatus Cybelea sp.]|nr:alkaline phosphatase family protein [Candidatus Cybelea sp.]
MQGRLLGLAEDRSVQAYRLARRALLCSAALTAGCGSSGSTSPATMPSAAAPSQYIKHVVIIVEENRSFDNMFSGFPGADAPRFGYAGKKRIALHPTPLENPGDIENNWRDSISGWNHGKMNGFQHEHFYGGPLDYAYAYVPRSESAPYWTMAKQYVLADRMFPTEFGPSFTAHLSLIAGNTDIKTGPIAEVDAPDTLKWGCEAPPGSRSFTLNAQRVEQFNGPFPCFDHFPTLADRLDAAAVTWKYYASPLTHIGGKVWSEFSTIRAVRYGPDWKNVISPQTRILTDVPGGALAGVSWVTPDWVDSDHTGSGYNRGPSWVASVVNAIGESSYWDSTAIFVLWDDWGGWYDDVPPPQLDFRGLGIRVPCIVISPYAKRGYVAHTQYEYGSILKTVEELFGLPPIGPASAGFTDTRASDMFDAFDFTQAPRAFSPIPAPYSESSFLRERPSFVPPDNY